jgi:hypothetical protein
MPNAWRQYRTQLNRSDNHVPARQHAGSIYPWKEHQPSNVGAKNCESQFLISFPFEKIMHSANGQTTPVTMFVNKSVRRHILQFILREALEKFSVAERLARLPTLGL